jgi:hypothetical protein
VSSERIATLRSGSWLYDGVVTGQVRILKIKGDGPNITVGDDPEGLDFPTDADGYYYVAEIKLPTLPTANNGSSSWGYATADEAIRYAEQKLPNPITWDDPTS